MYRMTSKDRMEREAVMLADYMIATSCVIEELVSMYGIPRTTVHRRLTKTLAEVDLDKWDSCQAILKEHWDDALYRARKVLKEKRAQK